MSATSRGTALWRSWARSERVAALGLAVLALGTIAEAAAGSRNFNGGVGASPIMLVSSLAIAGGLVVVGRAQRRGRTALASPSSILVSASIGLVILASLDVVDIVRTTNAEPLGGLVGAIGRGFALAGSIILTVGVVGIRRSFAGPGWLAELQAGRGLLLVRLGALGATAGWAILTVLGDGFAIRALDALGLEAAIIAALGVGPGLFRGKRAAIALGLTVSSLAFVAAVAALDGLTQVAGVLDELVAGPAIAIAGYVVYLAGVALIVAGALVITRPALPTRSLSAEGSVVAKDDGEGGRS